MKTAQAGTVESMDCLVTVSEAEPGTGIALTLAGSSVARSPGPWKRPSGQRWAN